MYWMGYMYLISTNRNPFVASKGMDRLSNGQKDFCNKLLRLTKSVLSKNFYLLKGLIVVEPTIGVKLFECGTCRNEVHLPHSAWGFWLFIGWKHLFRTRLKARMRGIMRTFHLCDQVFEFLVQTHISRNWVQCRNGVHVPHSVWGFWLFIGWKSKVKGMNDQGIMRTFLICVRVLPEIEI